MKNVTALAPVNIAIIKYWGKKDEIKVLPYNPSISFSLEALYTKTTLKQGETPGVKFFINGELQSDKEHKKVTDFLRLYKGFNPLDSLIIDSQNVVPTAAGFASSASGFAALAIAANRYFNTDYSLERLTEITRQGSGSAVRSLLGGAVMWKKDGTIEKIQTKTEDLAMIFVVINDQAKSISSRNAMKHTKETSPLFEYWVKQASQDAEDMIIALKENNFEHIGKIMESNSQWMHATTLLAQPPFSYFKEASFQVYECVYALRALGINVYATMDAGPNVKLLTKIDDIERVVNYLNDKGFNKIIISKITDEGGRIIHE